MAIHDVVHLVLGRDSASGIVDEGHYPGIALVWLHRVHLCVAAGPELRLNLRNHTRRFSLYRRKVRAQSAIWANGQDAPAAIEAVDG